MYVAPGTERKGFIMTFSLLAPHTSSLLIRAHQPHTQSIYSSTSLWRTSPNMIRIQETLISYQLDIPPHPQSTTGEYNGISLKGHLVNQPSSTSNAVEPLLRNTPLNIHTHTHTNHNKHQTCPWVSPVMLAKRRNLYTMHVLWNEDT